jgi:hypothetical protein
MSDDEAEGSEVSRDAADTVLLGECVGTPPAHRPTPSLSAPSTDKSILSMHSLPGSLRIPGR